MHQFSLSLDIHISLLYIQTSTPVETTHPVVYMQTYVHHSILTQYVHTSEVTQGLHFTCYTFIHIMQPLSHMCTAPVMSIPVHCTEVTWYCIAQ